MDVGSMGELENLVRSGWREKVLSEIAEEELAREAMS